MFEHCGVIGVYSLEGVNVVPMTVIGLEALQHRGQESWGITIPEGPPYKRLGPVSQMEDNKIHAFSKICRNMTVGHVRYTTSSKSIIENAHPLEIGQTKKFYICHNGTLDREPIISYLKKSGVFHDPSATDTELLGRGIHHILKRGKDWIEAFQILNPILNGSFSLTILTDDGQLVCVRDDRGFRPLCLGWKEEASSYIVASESCALEYLDATLVRDIEPGEIIQIASDGLTSNRFAEKEKHAHCAFEYTYFAHPSSYLEKINVYQARKNMGILLADQYPFEGDVVIPVPDSARPAALGYSEKSGIPFEEGLMKNRYRIKGSWRSFIEPEGREDVVTKITPIKHVVKGKRVILIDDSIVRGTSSKIIIEEKLRYAKNIAFFLTFPPIRHPCFMGIDFPTKEELLVYRSTKLTDDLQTINKKISKEIGVDFLGYNDLDNLCKGIGIQKDQLCLACTTGDYSCLKPKPKSIRRI